MHHNFTWKSDLSDGYFVIWSKSSPKLFLLYKRIFDLITSILLLPVLALLSLVIFILNPFLNSGRLIFVQKRLGKNGRVFNIYKFRTMQENISSSKSECSTLPEITFLGRFMRNTHIDELPQIINVFLGQMSVIGPRPEQVTSYLDYAQSVQGFAKRLAVQPGISGLAQLRYGHTDNRFGAQQKLNWDLEYIKRQGFLLDNQIYLQTYFYVLFLLCKNVSTLFLSDKS